MSNKIESPLAGKKVTIIRLAGKAHTATLFDGTKVTRRSDDIIRFYYDGKVRNFRTAEYDNHFCYDVPDHIIGWTPMCTCGSPAAVVGYNVYKSDSSPSTGDKDGGLVPGQLIVCIHHATYGKHADGAS